MSGKLRKLMQLAELSTGPGRAKLERQIRSLSFGNPRAVAEALIGIGDRTRLNVYRIFSEGRTKTGLELLERFAAKDREAWVRRDASSIFAGFGPTGTKGIIEIWNRRDRHDDYEEDRIIDAAWEIRPIPTAFIARALLEKSHARSFFSDRKNFCIAGAALASDLLQLLPNASSEQRNRIRTYLPYTEVPGLEAVAQALSIADDATVRFLLSTVADFRKPACITHSIEILLATHRDLMKKRVTPSPPVRTRWRLHLPHLWKRRTEKEESRSLEAVVLESLASVVAMPGRSNVLRSEYPPTAEAEQLILSEVVPYLHHAIFHPPAAGRDEYLAACFSVLGECCITAPIESPTALLTMLLNFDNESLQRSACDTLRDVAEELSGRARKLRKLGKGDEALKVSRLLDQTDRSEPARRIALTKLIRLAQFLPTLGALLSTGSLSVQVAAAAAIGAFGRRGRSFEEDIVAVLTSFRADDHPQPASSLLETLRLISPRRPETAMVLAMLISGSKHSLVRRAAVDALFPRAPLTDEIGRALASGLEDDDHWMRESVTRAINRLDPNGTWVQSYVFGLVVIAPLQRLTPLQRSFSLRGLLLPTRENRKKLPREASNTLSYVSLKRRPIKET